MMTAKRKKTITVETFQSTVIRQNSTPTQKIWCEFCQAQVETTTPDLAATFLSISLPEIYRLIERGDLHFIETESLSICCNSLKI